MFSVTGTVSVQLDCDASATFCGQLKSLVSASRNFALPKPQSLSAARNFTTVLAWLGKCSRASNYFFCGQRPVGPTRPHPRLGCLPLSGFSCQFFLAWCRTWPWELLALWFP